MPTFDPMQIRRRARAALACVIGGLAAVSVLLQPVLLQPVLVDPAAAAGSPTFKSAEAAYEQGMGAWRSGYLEVAVPALQFAAESDVFLAQFYLARIYADSNTLYSDQAAAYRLYQRISNDYADVDPDDDHRAPFVAKALTALAGYVREGLAAIDLKPDPVRAVEILRHAAQAFNHEDAQFELAKLHLKGEGVAADPRTAMHWLSVLTQRGHAGAQAFLADIFWRGRYNVARDQVRAFALITVAVENASDTERIWIEDIYQNIFCGASSGMRTQAQGLVNDVRRKYGRVTISTEHRYGLGGLPPQAARSCSNGEAVAPLKRDGAGRDEGRMTATAPSHPPSIMRGGMLGVGAVRTQPER